MALWQKIGENLTNYNGNFGNSISTSADGTRVAIGAPLCDKYGVVQGMVIVYEYYPSISLFGDPIKEIFGYNGDEYVGGTVKISKDGSKVGFSLLNTSVDLNKKYKIRIMQRMTNGTWVQNGQDFSLGTSYVQTSIYNPSIGFSFAGSGTRVALSAPLDSAIVYDFNGVSWQQIGNSITGISNAGHIVEISEDGTTVAYSEKDYSATGKSKCGVVSIYKYFSQNNTWNLLGNPIEGKNTNEYIGQSLSLSSSGTRVAIGSGLKSSNVSGLVRVYDYNATSSVWTQIGQDIKDGTYIGESVALSSNGEVLVAGANQYVKTYMYKLNDLLWQSFGGNITIQSQSNNVGKSVSVSSNGKIVYSGANGIVNRFYISVLPNFTPCFGEDVEILCMQKGGEEEKYVKVKNLENNDDDVLIKTSTCGFVKIHKIVKGTFKNNVNDPKKCMYEYVGSPEVKLTGSHGVAVRESKFFIQDKHLFLNDGNYLIAAAELKDDFAQVKSEENFDYYHISLENDEDDGFYLIYVKTTEGKHILAETIRKKELENLS